MTIRYAGRRASGKVSQLSTVPTLMSTPKNWSASTCGNAAVSLAVTCRSLSADLYSPATPTPSGGHVIAAWRRNAVIATASLLLLSGCGTPSINAATLLKTAKGVLDATSSFHFTLSSTDVTGSGPLLTGGSGDMKRPDSMHGTLQVSLSGFSIGVPVVSVGGVFSVMLPTSPGFATANPSDYGFADPAKLIDPNHGLSSLLLDCQSPQIESDDRYNGEALHEVSCTLPGAAVAALLTSADPSKTVAAIFGIDISTNQLRRVVLTGPFISKTTNSTYTLILANYGENVTITPPPAAG
jgi:lipoprotein LprG